MSRSYNVTYSCFDMNKLSSLFCTSVEKICCFLVVFNGFDSGLSSASYFIYRYRAPFILSTSQLNKAQYKSGVMYIRRC